MPEAAAHIAVAARVVCGIDGSPEGLEAARQAAVLAGPQGRILLVAAVDPGMAAPAGVAVTSSPAQLRAEAATALEEAFAAISPRCVTDTALVEDLPAQALRARAQETAATLIACGIHGRSRLAGLVLGSVATALLHEAPCSVLVARAAVDPARFPRRIVVGLDGSPPARAALAAAAELAQRLRCELAAIVALGSDGVDVDACRAAVRAFPDVTLAEDAREPADALVASGADLLMVGSRGLHGLRALGAVSEQVAHKAGCSVLVVR